MECLASVVSRSSVVGIAAALRLRGHTAFAAARCRQPVVYSAGPEPPSRHGRAFHRQLHRRPGRHRAASRRRRPGRSSPRPSAHTRPIRATASLRPPSTARGEDRVRHRLDLASWNSSSAYVLHPEPSTWAHRLDGCDRRPTWRLRDRHRRLHTGRVQHLAGGAVATLADDGAAAWASWRALAATRRVDHRHRAVRHVARLRLDVNDQMRTARRTATRTSATRAGRSTST